MCDLIKKEVTGFTLVELVATVAILALLLKLAVPSFTGLINDYRLNAYMGEFYDSISLARAGTAQDRDASVVVCASSSRTQCDSDQWQKGWLVFLDKNNNRIYDAGVDVILKAQSELVSSVQLFSYPTLNQSKLVFNKHGQINYAGAFVVCDHRGDTSAQAVIVSQAGYVRMAIDENNDSIVNVSQGVNVKCQ